MRNIIGKREYVERNEQVKVSDRISGNEAWSCDRCHLLYERDDTIIRSTKGDDRKYVCPRCGGRVYGGSLEYYEKEYLIEEEHGQ